MKLFSNTANGSFFFILASTIIFLVADATAAVKSVFRASDPMGGFSALTQPFAVVQRVYPQAVTGRITSAATGSPLTNGIVGLYSLSGSITFAQTDTNGRYTIYCLPGLH